jgi:hypothetical protein
LVKIEIELSMIIRLFQVFSIPLKNRPNNNWHNNYLRIIQNHFFIKSYHDMSKLTCLGCPVILTSPCCPVPAILSWLSCSVILHQLWLQMSWLSLIWLSCHGFPVPASLS